MSRIGLPSFVILFLIATPAIAQPEALDPEDISAMIEAQREELGVVDRECESQDRLIVVCGLRNEDDRYRLPLETVRLDDPANEGVHAERERIQLEPSQCQDAAFFKSECGMVGVSFGVGGRNSGFRTGGLRRAGN